MDAPIFANVMELLGRLASSPIAIGVVVFQVWMLIDAIRAREWGWAVFILVFPGFGSFWYFFTIYRGTGSGTRGFELPGAVDRSRIKELQGQIHHLDKAHHHSQLGDIYFQQGKHDKADACYRAALERDGQDIDTRAHFAQCLLRQHKAPEARPILEGVIAENPKHEYGYSLMALAETYMALGEIDAAIATWRRVTENHDYARARVQLADLLIRKGEKDAARAGLNEVLADFPHTPAFQRKRDRVWVRRAKKLIGQVGG